MSLHEFAATVGISLEEMRDIEDHDDEIFDLVDIAVIKKIAAILGTSPSHMLGVHKVEEPRIQHKRHKFIRMKRQEKKLSIEELGEMIGFYPEVIQKIELNEDGLDDALPYWAVMELAEILEIPLAFLLDEEERT